MKKTFTLLIALFALSLSAWATPTTITWNAENGLTSIDLSEYTNNYWENEYHSYNYGTKTAIIEGIAATISATADGSSASFYTYENSTSISLSDGGTLTFYSGLYEIQSIVINYDGDNGGYGSVGSPTEWSSSYTDATLTWTGSATHSVVLANAYVSKITSIVFTVEAIQTKSVTWDHTDVETISLSCSSVDEVQTSSAISGITASLKRTSAGQNTYCQFTDREIWINDCGEITFTSSIGDIVGIVITSDHVYTTTNNLSTGWTYNDVAKTLTWTGTASDEVTLSGSMDFKVFSIEFTLTDGAAPVDPTPTTTTIEWDNTDLNDIGMACNNAGDVVSVPAIDGISASLTMTNSGQYTYCRIYENGLWISKSCGYLTFSSSIGDISGIVITYDKTYQYHTLSDLSTGWTDDNVDGTITWTGTAAEQVTITGDIDIKMTSIEFTVIPTPVVPTPTDPSFTWGQRQISLVNLYCYGQGDNPTTHVIKNIITSLERTSDAGEWCGFWNGSIVISNNGTLTFQSIVGDITKIVITCSSVQHSEDLSTGWTHDSEAQTFTWESTAAEEVSFSGNIGCYITSIEFFYSPAAAPRLGETFTGSYYQTYEITGAHTAKMPQQGITHTLNIPEYEEYDNVRYYITEIDDYAFYGQDELPNAYIGENIAKIGAHAFDGCIRMEEMIINSEVLDTIGEGAFKDCKIMAYVECHTEQPPVLGSNAFSGDNYLNHFYVYEHVVNAYKAASGWSALSSKIGATGTIPAAGEIFFFRNQMTRGLYAVTVGATYSANGEAKVMPYSGEVRSFYPIEYEGTLVISEEVTYMQKQYSITGIGANAYKDSARINVVLIPEAMKSIESGAFLNCTGVKNVIFLWDDPTTVTWADADKGLEFATAASGNTKIIVPEGKLAAYQAWAPAWADCMIQGELLNLKATADPEHTTRFYRTFYDSTTDYMMPPSVWAHAGYVRGYEFILHPVAYDGQILPKGTPVVLESETSDYRLIAIDGDASAYTGRNDLQGTDVSFPRSDLGADADKVYVLGTQSDVETDLKVAMGLYRYTGTNLGANKAYMILDISNTPESGNQPAPARFVFRHEDTATSFENVQTDNDLCTKILRDGQLIIIRDGKEYNAQGLIIK